MKSLQAVVHTLNSRFWMGARDGRYRLLRYPGQLLIALILVLAALVPAELASANSYNCINYCYGAATFAAGPTGVVTGVNSLVFITPLFDNDSDMRHILNEVWTEDTHIYPNPPHGAYVEDGYISRGGVQSYFWGNWRPQDKAAGLFIASQVPAGDYFDYTYFEVQQDTSTQWHMIISSNNYFLDTYSINNSMTGRVDQIGLELSGVTSGSAQRADFVENYYAEAGGVHYPWDSVGPLYQNGPPSSGWAVRPDQSPTGGDWYTECDSNGGDCPSD